MNMKRFACLAFVTSFGAAGCPSIDNDGPDEGAAGPTVEFDPAGKVIPFPNNLLLSPMTGKVTLPAQCNETPTAKALREGVLNQLDGFGTFETALAVTFTEPVDMASLTDHVFLFKRAAGGIAIDPATSTALPIVFRAGTTTRFDLACANPATVDQVVVIARVPLDQKSTYVVTLIDGVKTATGADFKASFTWSLVRSPTPVVVLDDNGNVVSDRTPLDPADPEQLAQLQGIDLLWKAHAKALAFLKAKDPVKFAPETVVLAWEFNTQTVTDPLDATVTGSPASVPTAAPLLGNSNATTTGSAAVVNRLGPFAQCVAGDNNTQCFLKISIGKGNYAVGDATCAALGCGAIGDVLGSLELSKQFLTDTTNPYTGTGALPIPGQWNDPKTPTVVHDTNNPNPLANAAQAKIEVLVTIPATAAPAAGYPTVVFQHGLGQSKTNLFAVAGRLSALGFATVAIDAVSHDSRAVRISNTVDADPKKTCADVTGPGQRPDLGPSPVASPQCYAPFLSSNLGATRDGIRQTVLDQAQLINSLKTCGITACGTLKVDPAHIVYMGQSLGGIMGSVTTALRGDITASVLNVPGVGWVDILENTKTLQISCSLVDGLIGAGILVGEKSNLLATPPTGLCTTDEWKTQPGYQQFAVIGRWVLDPADPANFTSRLAAKKFLIQEVVGDTVVSNVATDNEGALVGLAPGLTADPFAGGPASVAITTNPTASKFVKYPTLPPDAATGFPGNTFSHGSLLVPANGGNDGRAGTGRMQTDAFTFLSINK